MLLIIIAMQVIGVYFVRELETTLKDNFKTSIYDKVNLLSYYLEEQILKERSPDDGTTLEGDIRNLLNDYRTTDIIEVRVIDEETLKIIGTSDPDNQIIVGQKSTNKRIWRVIATAQSDNQEQIDKRSGKRIWVLVSPVKANGEIVGAIYLESNIENVFGQMKQINKIFITGTVIALAITVFLGILLAKAITKPISDMRKQASGISKRKFFT